MAITMAMATTFLPPRPLPPMLLLKTRSRILFLQKHQRRTLGGIPLHCLFIQQQQQQHQQQYPSYGDNDARQKRRIVTSLHPPSPQAFIERPETIVFVESSLYNSSSSRNNNNSKSWKDAASSFFPMCGLQFATIDLFHPSSSSSTITNNDDDTFESRKKKEQLQQQQPSLESLEATLIQDLSHIASNSSPFTNENEDEDEFLLQQQHQQHHSSFSSAHLVLIARGPIQCLIAQYYLESNPLAGLVLVDPLLIPENGRREEIVKTKDKEGAKRNIVDGRWEISLSKLMSALMIKNMNVTTTATAAAAEGAITPLIGAAPTTTTTTTAVTNNIDPPLLLPIPSSSIVDNEASSPSSTSLEIKFFHNLLLQSASSSSSSTNNASSTTTNSASSEAHPRTTTATPTPLRPLKLEPNSVPILVLYSGDHMFEEYYRECAEWTAEFHAAGGSSCSSSTTAADSAHTATDVTTTATDVLSQYHFLGRGGGVGGAMVWKIPNTIDHPLASSSSSSSGTTKQEDSINKNNDDNINSLMMMRIYEWYDERVA